MPEDEASSEERRDAGRVSRRSFFTLAASGVGALWIAPRVDASASLEQSSALPVVGDAPGLAPPGAEALETIRVGQLTGSVFPIPDSEFPIPGQRERTVAPDDPGIWRNLVDVERWPLLNDTGRWGVRGVDLGANTEHNGRLYIFFGDVATLQGPGSNLRETDLIAWTDETKVLKHGGHLAMGYRFVLPHGGSEDATNQPGWAFCDKRSGLFWNGYSGKGFWPADGLGHHAAGLDFVLPHDVQEDANSQASWHYCDKCYGLFWFDPRAKDIDKGKCPRDGEPHWKMGHNFVLPHDVPENAQRQGGWRFCVNCHGLFFDGYASKGVCAASRGGGFHLNAVLRKDNPQFYPFTANPPVEQTLTFEVPNGAFSYGGRVYVFAGINSRTPYEQDPGLVPPLSAAISLVATPQTSPSLSTPSSCSARGSVNAPATPNRDRLESHNPLGLKFVLPFKEPKTDPETGQTVPETGWRFCVNCAALFWSSPPDAGRCFAGGTHEAGGHVFMLTSGEVEDAENQPGWDRCIKCASVFYGGGPQKGFCPAGGDHEPGGNGCSCPTRAARATIAIRISGDIALNVTAWSGPVRLTFPIHRTSRGGKCRPSRASTDGG